MRSVPATDTADSPPHRGGPLAPRLAWAVLCWCALYSAALGDPLATRLRVTLSAALPTAWQGEVLVEGGTLERLQPLSLDPAAAAGTSLDGGVVRLHHAAPSGRDAFDVTVRADPGATLQFVLRSDSNLAAIVPLAEARATTPDNPWTTQLGESGVTVAVVRMPADRLRVATDRASLIFEPGELFAFGVQADPAGLPAGEAYDLVATLSHGRTGAEVWRSSPTRLEATGDGPALASFEAPLPADEGVYRVTLAATKPSGFRSRFLPGANLLHHDSPTYAERTFQLAVMDPQRRPAAPGDWRETYAFDPRSQRWSDRVPEWMRWRRLPWFATGPRSSEEAAALGEGAISPSPGGGRVHWRAYPLPIDQPGATYAVEVETLGEPGDRLTVTVLEPDALGDLRPVSGAVTHQTPRWNRGEKRPPMRLMLRPRTSSPLLVLSNPHGRRVAKFGKVRLLKSAGVVGEDAPAERLVALDWSDPDLPHAVGASHARSRIGRFEQPDLATFWETATTVADRVEAAGANGAVVTVNQAGGAIYPSRVWGSPRFDLAAWSDGAADLPRRELLTLLVREFERRGLRLTPAVRLDATTVAADAAAAREAAVDEVLEAVGPSPALAGVAVRVSTGGWELLHGAADPDQTERLARSYDALSQRVAERSVGPLPLLLLPGDLVRREEYRRVFVPRLGTTATQAVDVVNATGLAAIGGPAVGVALPYGASAVDRGPSGDGSPTSLTLLRRAISATDAPAPRSLASGGEPLRLIDSARLLRRAAEGVAATDVILPSVAADPGVEGTMLAEAAQSGSPVVTLDGHASAGRLDDDATRRRRLLATLPVPMAADVTPEGSASTPSLLDVAARAFDTADASIAVVTNNTAWPTRARVTVDTPERLRGAPIKSGAVQWFDRGRHALDIELGPFESVAWRFTGAGVRVDGVRVDPSPAALRELAEALADLQSRNTTQRRPYTGLRNPSFEEPGEGGGLLAGWTAGDGVTVDADDAIDGAASVRLRATPERTATLSSEPFAAPTTGQFVLGLRLAPGALTAESQLLIDLEQIDGPYRNRAPVSVGQLAGSSPAEEGVAPDWLPLVLPIDDLPLSPDSEYRLRFTLVGEGEVRLDDLRPEDLLLPMDGYGTIDLRTERFAIVRLLQASQNLLNEGRLEACRELLDSYWARFLVNHFPPREADTVAADKAPPAPPAEDEPPTDATPSLSERVRGYLWPWR